NRLSSARVVKIVLRGLSYGVSCMGSMEKGFLTAKGRGIDGSVVSSPVVDENVVAVGNTKDVNVGKSVNFPTLITPAINGTDVAVPLESIRAISERFDNTIYGFFLFSFMNGLDSMLENGPWFRSNYDRAMIELQADVELKDTIVVAMPKLVREGFYTCNIRVKYEWKPPRCACCKVSGHVQDEYSKKIGSDVAKNFKNLSQAPRGVLVGPIRNKKEDAVSRKEVSNPNPFDVLNSVENGVNLGTNGGTSNLDSKEANSSGSSFWNVESSSISTTHIVDKIDKIGKLIIDGKITLMDDEGKPVEQVAYPGDHNVEDEVEPVDNEMASFLA
ncbi:hypothetical protein Tco_1323271, partial [Tanacetum coccineum]